MSVQQRDVDLVLDQLARGPRLVISVIREVPAELLKRRPAAGVWSAHEHAVHVPAVQPIMMRRLEQMLTEPKPVIRPYEPSRDKAEDALLSVDLDEAMDRLVHERGEMVERLKRLSLVEWSKTAEHGEYSHYSVFIMFRHLALHDVHHAYKIEERLLRKDWA
jgi:uncharacterized damage-inducible protein DinB